MPEIDHGTSESRGRKGPRFLRIVIAILIVVTLFAVALPLQSNRSTEIPPTPAGIAYSTHSPIYIYGNAAFIPANGVTGGNGSQSNPYIISGWDIDPLSTNNQGIWIEGTTAYFMIRDCYIHRGAGIGYCGIYLKNCMNGIVSNNTCFQNLVGIYLSSSNGNTLINNTISNEDFYGIQLRDLSNNNIITRNRILNCSSYGVMVESEPNNVIWHNVFFGNNGASIVRDPAHVQAYDGGANNRWNAIGSPIGYGNYWSDWRTPDADSDGIVDISYNLTGSAGAKDYYPVVSLVPGIPEPSMLILAGIMTMVFMMVGRTRKKP